MFTMQQIKRIDSAIDCQWFCAPYYSEQCTLFSYDEQNRYCKIYTGPAEDMYDYCDELGFSSHPSLAQCVGPMNASNNEPCHVICI